MARHRLVRHRASLVLLLIGLLLSSSTTAARAIGTTRTTEGYSYPRSRKLLVTALRVAPDTRPSGSQQEMNVGGWRRATPFRRAGASLGRRVPGSHANPSHN
ncbi:hypothetical protein PVAP13_1NG170800 [Panicum virgatum]|jgi:hypothetical protein|uniref:Secreted protein n=1 Tax=Panicum virgatum TaxID=38727 RepID=A0A8T0X0F9_PANVG|nr:hypothetical protein PVAP13_1NG170800 [Panicum virgatum]